MSDHERTTEESLRSQAIAILKKRRDFHAHLLIYALVNTALVMIWAFAGGGVFFWPIFPIVFWGIGVVMNGWDVYFGDGFSEEKIERQMHRLQMRH
jgi:hypothetical protein